MTERFRRMGSDTYGSVWEGKQRDDRGLTVMQCDEY
jgi:hypothetical protein